MGARRGASIGSSRPRARWRSCSMSESDRIAARTERARVAPGTAAAVLALAVGAACEHRSPPLATGEHRFTSDGVELAYHVAGAGPPCIVHPGGPGMEWSYLRMPELERRLTLVYLEPA